MLTCRKFGHPWYEYPATERPAVIFPSTSLPVIALRCDLCGTERFDEYRRNGQLNRRRYLYQDAYKAFGEELKDMRREGETAGQAATRRFLMERGLIQAPARLRRAAKEEPPMREAS